MKQVILYPEVVELISFFSDSSDSFQFDTFNQLSSLAGIQNTDWIAFNLLLKLKPEETMEKYKERRRKLLGQGQLNLPKQQVLYSCRYNSREFLFQGTSDVTIFCCENSEELDRKKLEEKFKCGQVIYIEKKGNRLVKNKEKSFLFGTKPENNLSKKPFKSVPSSISRFFAFIKSEMLSCLTRNDKSKRPFWDYFLGIPGALTDDEGNKIHLNLVGKVMAWMTYCLGGFILKPLQNIAKCIFEVLPIIIIEGMLSLIERGKHPLIVWPLMITALSVIVIPYRLIHLALIRPILSPIDNIKDALSFEDTKTGKGKVPARLLAGLSATVTTLFYGSLIVLTAGLAISVIAPTVTVPVLSAVGNTILGGLTSLFGSLTAAIATAMVATNLPVISLVSNGVRTVVEKTARIAVKIKKPKNLNSSNDNLIISTLDSNIGKPVNGSNPVLSTVSSGDSLSVGSSKRRRFLAKHRGTNNHDGLITSVGDEVKDQQQLPAPRPH